MTWWSGWSVPLSPSSSSFSSLWCLFDTLHENSRRHTPVVVGHCCQLARRRFAQRRVNEPQSAASVDHAPRPSRRPAATSATTTTTGAVPFKSAPCSSAVMMSFLASGQIFRELQVVHDTGYFSATTSLEDHWQEVCLSAHFPTLSTNIA